MKKKHMNEQNNEWTIGEDRLICDKDTITLVGWVLELLWKFKGNIVLLTEDFKYKIM